MGKDLKDLFRKASRVFFRLALGGTFLAAVADRFGLWSPSGTPNVAWGDFQHFTVYTGKVNSFMPGFSIPFLAWAATVFETLFGIGLLTGRWTRFFALGSGILLLLFALAMTVSFGLKSPLNYSVFTASAFVLAGIAKN